MATNPLDEIFKNAPRLSTKNSLSSSTQSESNPLDEIFKNAPRIATLSASSTNMPQVPQAQPEQPKDFATMAQENVIDPFTSRFGKIDYSNQGITSNILQSAGALAGGFGDVVGNAIVGAGKMVLPKAAEDVIGGAVTGAVQGATNAIPEEVKQSFADWQQAHPEAAANLGAIVDIASLIPAGKGVSLVKNAAKLETAGSRMLKAEELAQRIVQPTKPELFNAKPAVNILKDVPVEKTRTYSELNDVLQKQNKSDLAKVTEELSKDTTPYRVQDFEINKNGIKFNPVTEAIITLNNAAKDTLDSKIMKDLNSFGAVTKDGAKLSKDTITQNDVNELAKLMGKYENAFKENGGLLKGDKYKRAENIRETLKEFARTGMSEEVANLDRLVSNRINLTKGITNMANKVGRTVQAAEKTGLLKNVAKFGFKTWDYVTGRLVSSIIRDLSKGGKLTAVELEQELQKNLKLLQEIVAKKDKTRLKSFLQGIMLTGASQAGNQVNTPTE